MQTSSPRRFSSPSLVAALFLALALVAAACGSNGQVTPTPTGTPTTPADDGATPPDDDDAWEQLVEAAQAEGQVTLYASKGEEILQELLDAFEEEYGISGEFVRIASGPGRERVEQELAAGRMGADVILMSAEVWFEEMSQNGELVEFVGPHIEAFPSEGFVAGGFRASFDPFGIVYNTELVEEPPTDWDSLLTQEGQRVGLVQPGISPALVFTYYQMRERFQEDFFESMAATQSPTVGDSSITLTQAVAAGELTWLLTGFAWLIDELVDRGAPVGFVIPSGVTWAVVHSAVVHAEAPNPNAALVLADFIASPRGQEVYNSNHRGYSLLPDIPGEVEVPETTELISILTDRVTPEMTEEITDLWARLF